MNLERNDSKDFDQDEGKTTSRGHLKKEHDAKYQKNTETHLSL